MDLTPKNSEKAIILHMLGVLQEQVRMPRPETERRCNNELNRRFRALALRV